MRYHVAILGRTFVVDLTGEADGWRASVDGRERSATLVPAGDGSFQSLLLGDASWNASSSLYAERCALNATCWRLDLGSGPIEARIQDERQKALAERVGAVSAQASFRVLVRTEMPGRVHAVAVRTGQRVASGALLTVVEAMKMENEFRSPAAGKITEVHVREGDIVGPGAPLVTLDADAS